MAFGLLLIVVESVRGRADLPLVATALVLGLLFSVIGLIVFDVAETLRRIATPAPAARAAALATDAGVFLMALLMMTVTPWNAVPAIVFAGLALTAALAHVGLALGRNGPRHDLVVVGAVVLLALCGGAAIAAAALAAVWRAGLDVLSRELPKLPLP